MPKILFFEICIYYVLYTLFTGIYFKLKINYQKTQLYIDLLGMFQGVRSKNEKQIPYRVNIFRLLPF